MQGTRTAGGSSPRVVRMQLGSLVSFIRAGRSCLDTVERLTLATFARDLRRTLTQPITYGCDRPAPGAAAKRNARIRDVARGFAQALAESRRLVRS